MRQQTQNSRQNGGGWVGPALYAISIQEKILIILDDPLTTMVLSALSAFETEPHTLFPFIGKNIILTRSNASICMSCSHLNSILLNTNTNKCLMQI